MTTQTQTLAEFLLTRIAEDEAAAKACPPLDRWETPHGYGMRFLSHESDHSQADTDFVTRFNPSRVLAECEAKRRIVEAHPWETRRGETFCECCCDDRCEFSRHRVDGEMPVPCCETLRHLAQPYADHEGFREEWRVA